MSDELNERVARTLFGFRSVRFAPHTSRHSDERRWLSNLPLASIHVECDDSLPLYHDGLSMVLKFSTSITDAWCVVERMRELGYSIGTYSEPNGEWQVFFYINEVPVADRCEPTLPVAICLAALQALAAKEQPK